MEILEKNVYDLYGIGPQIAKKLASLQIYTLQDVLFHIPLRYVDKTRVLSIGQLQIGNCSLTEGIISKVENRIIRGKKQLLITLNDNSGCLALRFFHFNAQQLKRLIVGKKIRVFGEIKLYNYQLCINHPEYKILEDKKIYLTDTTLTPIYPTTIGLGQNKIFQLTKQALQYANEQLTDLLPIALYKDVNLPSFIKAIQLLHRPKPDINEQSFNIARQRLAFEELLAHHLYLKKTRQETNKELAISIKPDLKIINKFIKNLDFKLTLDQQKAITDIQQDLMLNKPMRRLLQGEVGSGKTVIAAQAAVMVIGAGYQVAIMAPTDLLAEQHVYNMQRWLQPLNITIGLLTGKLTGKEKSRLQLEIASGAIQCICGTHSLFQDKVNFKNLAFVVIDEQHRFGVSQRLSLCSKGGDSYEPHQLIMTATPIPRTLTMTFYAHLDCSIIKELPPGRLPITTILISDNRRLEVISRVKNALEQGRQVYWVCTLVTESEQIDCKAAEDVVAELMTHFKEEITIGLIHGQMPSLRKSEIMKNFRQGIISLLVATTVIEVGVDVPRASLMIIENSERLGIAQLHQLRGRIGRGSIDSYCVLLYKAPLSNKAKQRLNILRSSQDGFLLAEEDLAIRGSGDIMGTRQAGYKKFKVADLSKDKHLIASIPAIANKLLNNYPTQIKLIIQRWIKNSANFIKA